MPQGSGFLKSSIGRKALMAVTGLLLIGFLILLAVAVWVIIRCVIGLQALGRGEPIQNPQSWVL